MSKKGNIKEVFRKIMFCISLVVFIGCSFKLYTIWREYHDNSKSYDEVREFAPEEVVSENNDTQNNEPKFVFKKEDYDSLLAMNSDFKAWLYIPNTEVSYPVVQTNNNDYYLKHNFKKEQNSGGAIFISSNNKEPFVEQNTIIHGHHMRDGSMFAGINKFKEEDFFDNGKIKIIKDNKEYFYEVFSVRVVDGNDNKIISHFNNDEEFDNYIELLKTESIYKKDEINSDFSKIITLFTCSYEFDNARTIISAALVE